LKILNNAFQNVSLSLVRSLNEPLTIFGHLVAGISDQMAKHRTTTTIAEGAGASAVLLRLLGRSSIIGPYVRRVPLVGRLAGGAGKAAGAAIMAEEAGNVVAGGAADGTRANPYWVIISPFSWTFGTGGMGYPVGGGPKLPKGGTAVEDAVKKVVGTGGAASAGAIGAAAIPAALTLGGGYLAIKYGNTSLSNEKKFHDDQQAYMLSLMRARERAEKLSVSGKADVTVHLKDADGTDRGKAVKRGMPLTKDTAPQAQGRPGVRSGR
jgi:hypothetical protein